MLCLGHCRDAFSRGRMRGDASQAGINARLTNLPRLGYQPAQYIIRQAQDQLPRTREGIFPPTAWVQIGEIDDGMRAQQRMVVMPRNTGVLDFSDVDCSDPRPARPPALTSSPSHPRCVIPGTYEGPFKRHIQLDELVGFTIDI